MIIHCTVKLLNFSVKWLDSNVLRTIVEENPKNLCMGMFENYAIYNMSFVPQNAHSRHLAEEKDTMDRLEELKGAFLSLGYGGQLSEALMRCAKDDKKWGGIGPATVTIGEAQVLLFKRWHNLSHQNSVALGLFPNRKQRWRRYFPSGKDLLVLNDGFLYTARCKRT